MIIAEGTSQPPHVEELRASIVQADREIVALIAHRLELVRALGEEKARHGLPTADPAREAAVLRNVSEAARAAGMPEEAVRDVFWCVIDMCRTAQLREQRA
jgi:chorismate mutase / prephenate dehydrogenase